MDIRALIKSVLRRVPSAIRLRNRIRVLSANKKLARSTGRLSYSQAGEDLIIELAFEVIKRPCRSYVDIGAYHPTTLSNTYASYAGGISGVCVEPNPQRVDMFRKIRPRDTCLHAGVGTVKSPAASFFVMTSPDLCTFSRTEAERLVGFGQRIEKTVSVPMLTIDEIVRTYIGGRPGLISLDVEGLDLDVLKSLNFEVYGPDVLCVETLDPVTQREKRRPLIEFVMSKGYCVFADTFINTIFVRQELMR